MAARRWSVSHLRPDTSAAAFASGIARRSRPEPLRIVPRDPTFAARLAAIDARDAETYAAMEMQAFQVRELARKMAEDGAPLLVIDDNDSIVNHIEAVTRASGTFPKAKKEK